MKFINALYQGGYNDVKRDYNILQQYINGDEKHYKNMRDILDYYHQVAQKMKNDNYC